MREAAARGPSIDITEFERRLRGQQPAKANERDPLEELARLLHGNEAAAPADPYREVFAEQAPRRAPSAPPAGPTAQATEPPYYHEDDAFEGDLRESFDHAAPAAAPAQQQHYHEAVYQQEAVYHDQNADWSLDESQAYLDYGAQEHEGQYAAAPAQQQHYHEAVYQQEAVYHDQNADWSLDESQAYLDYGAQEHEGQYAAGQDGREGGRRFPKFRLWHAVAGIAALGVASIGWTFAHRSGGSITPQEIATIATPDGPAKVPPVDPAAPPKTLRLGIGPVDAPHEPGNGLLPSAEPRKVKTVSVRPDGSVIDNDSAPGADTELALPLTRAAALLVNSAQANAAADSAPTVTPRSQAKTATTPRAAQPARPTPKKVAAALKNPDVNDNDAPATIAASGSGGAFAVQFAAADSEAEARQLMQQIVGKFGSLFVGRHLGYRYAKVGDKTVYRLRVGNLGKESAVGICEKVKSAGGNCFVAGN
jgi:hypothetical protein